MTPLYRGAFRAIAVLVWTGTGLSAQIVPDPTTAARRETLRLAERKASGLASESGLLVALRTSLAIDAVLLLDGAPLVRGREAVLALLDAQSDLRELKLAWEPFRVLVSSDGGLGVTF